MRGFIQADSYLHRLIEHFSAKAGPLYELIGGPKNQKVILNDKQLASFNLLRDYITTTPVIFKSHYNLSCTLETDAFQTDLGAALYQPKLTPNGKSVLHPVAYFSKRLTPTQQRYGAQERELLAIVLALQH